MANPDNNKKHPALCQTVDDFFAPRTRTYIGRLLEEWMDSNCLLPTELLCTPTYQNQLENDGFKLRNAIDRVAGLQSKLLGEESSSRINVLYSLISDLKTHLRTQSLQAPESPSETMRFQEIADAAQKDAIGAEATCRIGIALSAYLETTKWKDKVQRLIDLFTDVSSRGAVAFLDSFLSEAVGRLAVINDILNFPPSKQLLIGHLIAFLEPDGVPDKDLTGTAVALHTLLHERSLRECRYNIEAVIAQEIASTDPLGDYGIVNRLDVNQVISELRISRDFSSRLRKMRNLNNPNKLADSFKIRISRLISSDNLHDLIGGQSIVQKTETLLTMYGLVIDSSGRQMILEILKPIIKDSRFVEKVVVINSRPLDGIRNLGKLAACFEDAALPDAASFISLLGQAQHILLKKHNILAKINASKRPCADKALQVLDLCVKRVIVRGPDLDVAHKMLRAYMAQPDFLSSYLRDANNKTKLALMADLKAKVSTANRYHQPPKKTAPGIT